MPQTFQQRTELIVKLALLAVFLGAGAVMVLMVVMARPTEAEPVQQPIPFSHKHHVGDVGIDCRYCHTTVDSQPFAGMPTASTCLGCHGQLFKDAPVLRRLRESAATGRPIAWRRLHKLPDFVYFDHHVHVAKGVACIECHGRVDQMPLTWRVASLEMQWCLACHRDPAPHLHPPSEVFTMDQSSAPHDAIDPRTLARLAQLASRRRMTDCSTCHR